MASKKGRPLGSGNPQRVKSPQLRKCEELMRTLPLDEVAVVRAGATEILATEDGEQTTRDLCILGLSEADLRKREATGTGIRRIQDYLDFKTDEAPSVSTFYREFSDFHDALAEASLLTDLQPQTHLGVIDGRPKGGGKTYTDDDIIRAVARCYETMRGRRFSRNAFNDFRRMRRLNLPDPQQYTDTKSGRTWDHWLDAAADFIVREGSGCGCPLAYDFITRSRVAAKRGEGVA